MKQVLDAIDLLSLPLIDSELLSRQRWIESPIAIGTEVTVTGRLEDGDGLSGTGEVTGFEYIEGLGNCYCVLISGTTYRIKPILVTE